MTGHWLTRDRLKVYSAALLVLYLGITALLLAKYCCTGENQSSQPVPDFVVFWSAAHVARTGKAADAYDFSVMAEAVRLPLPWLKGAAPFPYPPTFLLLVLPLALLPYLYSYLVFSGTTLAAYLWVIRRICACQGLADAAGWWPLLGFPAVFLNLYKGQNGLLTAALAGAALLLLRSRPAWAGLLIGMLSIKPQLGLLLPLALVCGGYWRALFYAGFGAAAFMAISVAVLGVDTLSAFFSSLQEFSHWAVDNVSLQRENPSFFAFFHQLGLSSGVSIALHGAIAAAVACAVGWIWLRCDDFSLRAAALTAGTMLVSPHLMAYDLSWLALSIVWYSGYALRKGWLAWERELLVLVWLLPALTFRIHYLLPLQLDPFVLLGLFLMIWRRARRDGLSPPRHDAAPSAKVQSMSLKAGESTESSA